MNWEAERGFISSSFQALSRPHKFQKDSVVKRSLTACAIKLFYFILQDFSRWHTLNSRKNNLYYIRVLLSSNLDIIGTVHNFSISETRAKLQLGASSPEAK
jgi:hypothetical protein